MATSKSIKKTSIAKKPLAKAQFGMGSGPLGLPNFEERQQRKIARAKRKATVADIEGEGSVASKRDSRANRVSKVLGTGRSKARVMNNSGNNAGNTTDSYNKDSYNRDSYNTSNRPSSIMQSKPSGFQSADSMTGNTSNSQMESAPKKTYGPPRILKKGGVVKKKIVAKKK
jgi:hypothetical protein